MTVKNLRTAVAFDIWFIPIFNDGFSVEQNALGRIKVDTNENYSLVINHIPLPVKLRDQEQAHDLNFHLKRGCAHLLEVIQIVKEKEIVNCIFVKIAFFSGGVVEMEDVCIGIDEKISETAQNNNIRFSKIEDLCELLRNKCSINVENETYFLILCGAAAEEDFADIENSNPHAFALYGERVTIPVERRRLDREREAFLATKIVFKEPQKGERAFRLVHGKLKFVDFTKSGEQSEIKILAQAALRKLTEETGSYLTVWDKYSKAEGNILLEHARAIDIMHVQNLEPSLKGCKVFLREAVPEKLKKDDFLEVMDEIPLYLQDKNLDWETYQEALDTSRKESEGKKIRQERIKCQVQEIAENSITLKMEASLQEGCSLIFSIRGDETQIRRRQEARKAVQEGRCANPLLGILIAENGIPPNIHRVKQIPPLSPFVRDKIFRNEPREAQKKAIEIALNTPDFALIQGPPGTGKTTVITAILERLNELYDKTGKVRGKILVSGSQHDAVENITSRLSINALPTMKFGTRHSNDAEHTENVMKEWRKKLSEKIHDRHKDLSDLVKKEQQRKLSELFEIYAGTPTSATALEILKFIIELPKNILSEESLNQARNIKEILIDEDTLVDTEKLRLIRSLRVTEMGFADDGTDRAIEILDAFEDELTDKEQQLLSCAAHWKEGDSLSFLKYLKNLKRRLLLCYTPPPRYRVEKPRIDMLELIGDVREQLEKFRDDGDRRVTVLAEFLHELNNNPEGITETIADYSLVFASTVQYAGSDDMTKKKRIGANTQISYDTVIIDEAARVTPMDLLIPLSQAEKRVILVGDHRQLPQLIDDEIVEKALTDETPLNAETYSKVYQESMFGYLFNRLKKLEDRDGIPRIITLDAQFRMHPLLGKFVSDQFYREYGEEFESPLPAEYFRHNLPKTNGKAAIWLNVPSVYGGHEKRGTSSVRKAEADSIARLLARWIDCPDPTGKPLSFGIISFYKAQVDLLLEALLPSGISRKAESGKPVLNDAYEGRMRIGTVDSFQGMEFDVVFLSMVRSQSVRNQPISERLKKQVFGYLMSVNRLCVSMSRQKRLLVIAGNADLVQTKLAQEAVPALHAFYQLCQSDGMVL